MLNISLPDDYSIFHNVLLTRENGRNTTSHEIDYVIVNQSGDVLVIEQKNGALIETKQGLIRRNGGREINVDKQLQDALHTVRNNFESTTGNNKQLNVGYLLYCPDFKILDINTTGIDNRRCVDATNKDALSSRIEELLTPSNQSDIKWRDIVLDFFSQRNDT